MKPKFTKTEQEISIALDRIQLRVAMGRCDRIIAKLRAT